MNLHLVGNYKLKYNFESNSQRKIVTTKSKGKFSVVNWWFKNNKEVWEQRFVKTR